MIFRSKLNARAVEVIDFFTTFGGFFISYYIWVLLFSLYPKFISEPFDLTGKQIFRFLFFSAIYVPIFKFYKAYTFQRFTSLFKEYVIVLKVSIWIVLLAVLFNFLVGEQEYTRVFIFLTFIINLIILLVQKTLLFFIAGFIRNKGKNRKRILLIGTGTRAKKFLDVVNQNFKWGLDIIGLVSGDTDKVDKEFYGKKVLGHIDDFQRILKEENPEEVIFTISTRRFDRFREVFEVCEREGVRMRLNSDFFGKVTKKVVIDNVYGINIITFNLTNDDEIQLLIKRIIDIVGSIIALIIFSPLMIISYLGILITDGRPVFYQWRVVGKDKKPFISWKFRTMVRNADELKKELMDKNEMQGPVFKIKNDPRILPFCRWMRKWSIDETPQLFSVLKGDMSLVGPRPAGTHELPGYESWHRRKLSVKPGITCLWQVSGRNNIHSFDDWVRMDLEYIDKWNIWLDIKILLKTIPAVLLGKGAS